MLYREDKKGNKLSILGYGCMRLPRRLGGIDMQESERLVMRAIEAGVNYFDTAYIYPGSEAALGEILEKHNARDRVNITTKLPHYLIKSREKLEEMFSEELRRLRTDHVDYYLMHMLTDIGAWERMVEMGVLEWLAEKKASGAIRQVGFSYHGNSEMFCRLVDAYEWDLCMIQYNYMDEHTQAGRRGLQYAAGKGIPVVIMEPLRGGRLVKSLPEKAKKIFASHTSQRSPAEWAFRWLWNQEEVAVVLSGMSTMEMLEENIASASAAAVGCMSEEENGMLQQVADAINEKIKVGCTGCSYCMPCPMGVDIPGTFAAYNRTASEGWFAGEREYFMGTTLRKSRTAASQCIGCGKCEAHCPQGIAIREQLAAARKTLEGPVYKIAAKVAPWFTKF